MSNRCALTGKGIQYWEIIPKVFHLDVETDYEPCPFAGSVYQWMRNLLVAYKVEPTVWKELDARVNKKYRRLKNFLKNQQQENSLIQTWFWSRKMG